MRIQCIMVIFNYFGDFKHVVFIFEHERSKQKEKRCLLFCLDIN